MNTRKLISLTTTFLMMILSSAGKVSAANDTSSTSTDINNVSPAISQTVSDGGSSASSPTIVGNIVGFTTNAHDMNSNQYYLAICKTDAISAGNDSSPTCTGGSWAISPATNSNSQATANYTVQSGDPEINDWYAFVCDKVASTAACYPASGSGDQGSAVGAVIFSGVPVDGATLAIDGITYEFDTAGNGITGGRTEADTSSAQVGANAAFALFSVEAGTGSHMINRSNVVYVYADSKGASGNSIAMSKSGDTGSVMTLSGASLSGGSDDNASPFYVNQAGTFATVTVTDDSNGTIAPGDTMKFNLQLGQISDPYDVKMYICTSATTVFDYGTDTCTGGSLVCSSALTDPSSSDVTCTGGASLVAIPTNHGNYNYKVFVEDQFSTPLIGTETQSYTVINVPPTLESYDITDAPNPVAGSTDTMDFNALIQDKNGEADILSADGSFYDSNVAQNWVNGLCDADEKKCYSDSSCSINTASGDSSQVGISCSVTTWFNANASTSWKAHVNASDGDGKVTDMADSDSITNPPISGIDVAQPDIAYGTVVIGGISNSAETSMGNMGNQVIDVYLSGTDMTSGANSVPASQQKWNHTTGTFNWNDPASGAGPYPLITTPSGTGDSGGCLNRDIPVRTVHDSASTNESIFWKLKIPDTQAAGSYSGQNTFATTASDTCSTGVSY